MTVPRMKMMQDTVFVISGIMQLQSPNIKCTSSLGPRSLKMLGRGRLRGLLRSKKPATSPLMSTCASVCLSAARRISICAHSPQRRSQPGPCAAARRSQWAPVWRLTSCRRSKHEVLQASTHGHTASSHQFCCTRMGAEAAHPMLHAALSMCCQRSSELMRAHPGVVAYRLSDVQHCTALQLRALEHRPVQDEPAPAAGAEPERGCDVEPSQAAHAISCNQVKPDEETCTPRWVSALKGCPAFASPPIKAGRPPVWQCLEGAHSQDRSGEGSHDWPYSSMMSG